MTEFQDGWKEGYAAATRDYHDGAETWEARDEADARRRVIVVCQRALDGIHEVKSWWFEAKEHFEVEADWRRIMERLSGASTEFRRAQGAARRDPLHGTTLLINDKGKGAGKPERRWVDVVEDRNYG